MQMSLAGYIGLQKSGDAPTVGASPLFFREILHNNGNRNPLTFHGNNQSQYLKSPACAHQNQ